MKHCDTTDDIILKSIVDLSHQIKDLHEEVFLLRCEIKRVKAIIEVRGSMPALATIEYKRS